MSSIEEVKHLHIPIQELSDATNAFSDANLLARGGFGTVYKGISVKHGSIAIKMLDPWQGPGKGQGDHEFKTEIALLSVYKHENIVSLLGFCDEDGKKILVYKYESNGSLDKHLERKDLAWIQRLQICLDAARGLQYLHDDVEPRIFHRDIKSSNVLLDENLKAKISDFGLSRIDSVAAEHSFLISNPCGTYGYIDPEYTSTGCLTQKSDVYSFGVVLFEVLCGRLACVRAYHDERQFLTNLIKIHWRRKTLYEIIYSDIKSQIYSASFVMFSSIAYQCLMSGNERPTMKKVVEQLQKALVEQLDYQASASSKPTKKLIFSNEVASPVFIAQKITGNAFGDDGNTSIKVILVDKNTLEMITTGTVASAKVKLVLLRGDYGGSTTREFINNIVVYWKTKKSILQGDIDLDLLHGCGTVGEIKIKLDRYQITNVKFRLGAIVTDGPCEVQEAITGPFEVKDLRNKTLRPYRR